MTRTGWVFEARDESPPVLEYGAYAVDGDDFRRLLLQTLSAGEDLLGFFDDGKLDPVRTIKPDLGRIIRLREIGQHGAQGR